MGGTCICACRCGCAAPEGAGRQGDVDGVFVSREFFVRSRRAEEADADVEVDDAHVFVFLRILATVEMSILSENGKPDDGVSCNLQLVC